MQSFEFTFELAWKTLKDFLTFEGTTCQSPRQTIQEAFAQGLIENGHLWIEMLNKRDELTHTYNQQQAEAAVNIIKHQYFAGLEQVYNTLISKRS